MVPSYGIRSCTVLALFLPALVLAPSISTAAQKKVEETKHELTLDGRRVLEVENKKGDVRITGARKRGSILLRIVKRVSAESGEEADRLLEALDFDVEKSDTAVRITARYPDLSGKKGVLGLFSRMKRRAIMDYYLEVPSSLKIVVRTGSGDVAIARIDGDIDINTASGDVNVEKAGADVSARLSSGDCKVSGVKGSLSVTSASGDIVVEDLSGALVAGTASGDVEAKRVGGGAEISVSSGDVSISRCTGDVDASSTSGDLHLERIEGSIAASTSSGDIEVEIVPVDKRSFILKTASGDVNVRYLTPPGYGFLLEIKTGSGSISAELEILIEKVTRRYLKGVVGNGEALLDISTGSGSIRIVEVGKNRN